MKQTAVEWLMHQMLEASMDKETKEMHIKLHKDAFKQAKAMQDEQMQLTWNNAIDAVQKDKWYSYDEFYNETFKSE